MLDKTGSLPVSFPVQIIYRIVSYRCENSVCQIDKNCMVQALTYFKSLEIGVTLKILEDKIPHDGQD